MPDAHEWSPVGVERELLTIANDLSKGVAIATDAYERFLKADREFDLAYAHAFMRAEGSVDKRKLQADIDSMSERAARDAADVAYKFADKTNKALYAKLDAMRSVGTSVRQAYAVAGRGEEW